MCCLSNCTTKIIDIFKSIQRCFNTIAEDSGLTVPEMMIMLELYDNKVLSLNQLSKNIDLPKSSVSRLVDGLVKKGYIIREIPEENRRTVKLFISSKCPDCMNLSLVDAKFKETLLGNVEQEKADRIISALDELSSLLKSKT